MANYYVQEIFKRAITPEYQEYFEYSEEDKEIHFRQSIRDMFNDFIFETKIFDAIFGILAEQANGAVVSCYDFFFNENGQVDCKDIRIRNDQLTIELIHATMDKAIEVVKQTLIKYKEYKRQLMIKQMEEI